MKKVVRWIVEHVRPHFKADKDKLKNCDNDKEILENLKENAEVGIKIKFKF